MNEIQREHYRRAAQEFVERYAGLFDEQKHPRDHGKFAEKEGGGSVNSVAGDELASMQADLKQIDKSNKKLDKFHESASRRDKGGGRSRANTTTSNARTGQEAQVRDHAKDALRKKVRGHLAAGRDVPQEYLDSLGNTVDYDDRGAYAPVEAPPKPSPPAPFKAKGVAGGQMGLFGAEPSGQKTLFNVVQPPKKGRAKPSSRDDLLAGITGKLKEHLDGKEVVSPADLATQFQDESLPGQKSLFRRAGQVERYAGQWDEGQHPRASDGRFGDKAGDGDGGSSGTSKFQEGRRGTYWRIHPKEFTQEDLHDNHKSRLWDDTGYEKDEHERSGLSTTPTLHDLLKYFGGSSVNSIGRGAILEGAHLVQLEGEESDDKGFDDNPEYHRETLVHPTKIVHSAPLSESQWFMDRLTEEINGSFADRDEEIVRDPERDDWVTIPKGTGSWTKDARKWMTDEKMTISEIEQIVKDGEVDDNWDDWDIDHMPDEVKRIVSPPALPGQKSLFRRSGQVERYAGQWDESKHPRDTKGEFATNAGKTQGRDGHTKLPEAPDAARPELTEEEQEQVLAYVDMDSPFYEFNSELRAGGTMSYEAELLQGAIEKVSIFDSPITVVRGFELSGEDLESLQEELEAGELTDPGFMSTSRLPGGAFAGNVKLSIEVRKGLDVSHYTDNFGEVLLPAGSSFRVLSVKNDGKTLRANLEQIVDDGQKSLFSRARSGDLAALRVLGTQFVERYKQGGEHWVTIGGHAEGGKQHAGGNAVQIDGQGNIVGGNVPKEWQGKHISQAGRPDSHGPAPVPPAPDWFKGKQPKKGSPVKVTAKKMGNRWYSMATLPDGKLVTRSHEDKAEANKLAGQDIDSAGHHVDDGTPADPARPEAATEPPPEAAPATAEPAVVSHPQAPPRGANPFPVKADGRQPRTSPGLSTAPEPGKPGLMRVADLKRSPERFQYKLNVNKDGVTTQFKDVSFNPELAGSLGVWQDPQSGETFVVNGHHRHELAERSGFDGELQVYHLRAANEQEARAKGALMNIAGGHGTAIDAAKYFRDSGQTPESMKEDGVSLTAKLTNDAIILTKLSPALFAPLTHGLYRQGRALAIAKHLDSHEDQEDLDKLIERKDASQSQPVSDHVVEEMGRQMAMAARIAAGPQQATLPGMGSNTPQSRSTLAERAEISSAIRRSMTGRLNKFRAVSNERAAETLGSHNTIDADANRDEAKRIAGELDTFDRESVYRGPISDLLSAAAEELANEPRRKDEIISRVAEAISGHRPAVSEDDSGRDEDGEPGGGGGPYKPAPGQRDFFSRRWDSRVELTARIHSRLTGSHAWIQ